MSGADDVFLERPVQTVHDLITNVASAAVLKGRRAGIFIAAIT